MSDSGSPRATSSAGGTLYLIFIQIASRAFTFVGNQFLLRYLSPALLGLAVQLELLSVTILYFARENLRVALQRQSRGETSTKSLGVQSQQIVNLAYLAVAVGLCTSVGLGYGYLQKSSNEVLGSIDFKVAFQLYATATCLELLAEPCFVIVQQHSLFKIRARAETAAAVARCATACITAIVMQRWSRPSSVLPFAVGQLFYAVALLTTYLANVWPLLKAEQFSLLLRRITTNNDRARKDHWLNLFYKPLLSLTATFYAQSVFKLLLTQGDSLILSFLSDLKTQGAFALASNYGGLLSRLILQPIEESSRNVFGHLLATPDSQTQTPHSPVSARGPTNSQQPSSSSKSNTTTTTLPLSSTKQALNHLSTTLHLYTLVTLPIITLLPPLFPALTTLFLSPQWRNHATTTLLQAYIYYLPFIAVNGVLDAFVTSVATPAELRTQSLLMAVITAIYGGVAWVLMAASTRAVAARNTLGLQSQLGSEGLVYANMVNMALRILYSVWFVSRWVDRRMGGSGVVKWLWTRSVPGASCVVVALAVGGGLRSVLGGTDMSAKKSFLGVRGLSADDVGYVLAGTLVLGFSIIISEHQFLLNMVMPLIPKRLAAQVRPYLSEPTEKQD